LYSCSLFAASPSTSPRPSERASRVWPRTRHRLRTSDAQALARRRGAGSALSCRCRSHPGAWPPMGRHREEAPHQSHGPTRGTPRCFNGVRSRGAAALLRRVSSLSHRNPPSNPRPPPRHFTINTALHWCVYWFTINTAVHWYVCMYVCETYPEGSRVVRRCAATRTVALTSTAVKPYVGTGVSLH
jgi:hypothetical protein